VAFIAVILALGAAPSAQGQVPGGAQADTITVAVLAPLTIPGFELGPNARNGAQLAAEEWNKKGGVLGKKVVLEIIDTENDPAKALAKVKLAWEKGIRFYIGDLSSRVSTQLSDFLANGKGILISPGATEASVTLAKDGSVKAGIFRSCFIDAYQGRIAAAFAVREFGPGSVYVLVNKDFEYSRQIAAAFVEDYRRLGGIIAGQEEYPKGTSSFKRYLQKAVDSKASAIFLPDYYDYANAASAAMGQLKFDVPLFGTDAWESDRLSLAPGVNGYFLTHFSLLDQRPRTVKWDYDYQNRFGRSPDLLSSLAYDAMNILLGALDLSGSEDVLSVAALIKGRTWEGITGPIAFDDEDNPRKPGFIIHAVGKARSFAAVVQP
jgi:branched-chain amino acid transport system substrate-binding protein